MKKSEYQKLKREFEIQHYEKHLMMCKMLSESGERNRKLFEYDGPTFEEFDTWFRERIKA